MSSVSVRLGQWLDRLQSSAKRSIFAKFEAFSSRPLATEIDVRTNVGN